MPTDSKTDVARDLMTCTQEPMAESQRPELAPVRLPRAGGRFISHVFALMTGNGIAQAVQFSGTLVLARLCAPDSFGLYALFMTVVSLFSFSAGGDTNLESCCPSQTKRQRMFCFCLLSLALASRESRLWCFLSFVDPWTAYSAAHM